MAQFEIIRFCGSALVATSIVMFATSQAQADPLAFAHPDRLLPPPFSTAAPSAEESDPAALASGLRRQLIDYPTHEAPGTIVIDTPNTHLYLVLGGGKALRYGIGVGREGFTWSGVKTIERKVEWPDWFPPAEMLARQPYLPSFVAGGPGNPLGARALYLSGSVYRIHGTNDPSTIGKHVSSGCIRMLNSDVSDLYARVGIGTKVVVQGGRMDRFVTDSSVAPLHQNLAVNAGHARGVN